MEGGALRRGDTKTVFFFYIFLFTLTQPIKNTLKRNSNNHGTIEAQRICWLFFFCLDCTALLFSPFFFLIQFFLICYVSTLLGGHVRVCVASSFFSPLLFLNHLFFFFFCIVILTLSIFTIDVIRQNFMKTDKQALFSFVFFFYLR